MASDQKCLLLTACKLQPLSDSCSFQLPETMKTTLNTQSYTITTWKKLNKKAEIHFYII